VPAAEITIRRRIEWMDTDAAGIYHWTTAFRLTEAAEAAMHTALGIEEITFSSTPRVHVDFHFKSPLRFNDETRVTLAVDRVGRASVRYRVAIDGPDGTAVEGALTACFVEAGISGARPWPDEVRTRLAEGGPVQER